MSGLAYATSLPQASCSINYNTQELQGMPNKPEEVIGFALSLLSGLSVRPCQAILDKDGAEPHQTSQGKRQPQHTALCFKAAVTELLQPSEHTLWTLCCKDTLLFSFLSLNQVPFTSSLH